MASHGPGRGRVVRVAVGGLIVYRADYTDSQGKRHRQNLAGDRATAERMLAKLIRDRDLEVSGLVVEVGLDASIAELVRQYLGELRARSRERDVHETARRLGRMVSGMALVLVRDVTKTRVVAWRQKRLTEGAANKTVNNEVVTLAACLNLAVTLGQLASSPLAGLKPLPIGAKHQRRKPRALSEQEIASLLRAAAAMDARSPKLVPREPLLRFLVGTGARWSEAISLRWQDYDNLFGVVTFRAETTKTERVRTIPLQASVLEALEALRARLGVDYSPSARIFLQPLGSPWKRDGHNMRRWLGSVTKAAKIGPCKVHDMRHSFATRCARARVPPVATQRLLGHASLQMTMNVYTHLEIEDAREALRSLPPLPTSDTSRFSDAERLQRRDGAL